MYYAWRANAMTQQLTSFTCGGRTYDLCGRVGLEVYVMLDDELVMIISNVDRENAAMPQGRHLRMPEEDRIELMYAALDAARAHKNKQKLS